MSGTLMRLKSKVWHRERMVGRILCFSVVARMKMRDADHVGEVADVVHGVVGGRVELMDAVGAALGEREA